jgi:hypothetical protein
MFGNPPKSPTILVDHSPQSPNHEWLTSYQKGSEGSDCKSPDQQSPDWLADSHQSPDWLADGQESPDWLADGQQSPDWLDNGDNLFL